MSSTEPPAPSPVTDPEALRETLLRTLDARTTHRGEVVLPCIPAPVEHYLERLRAFFAELGKPLSDEELASLRELVLKNLEEGYRAKSGAKLVVRYETSVTPSLQKNLACSVAVTAPADRYEGWAKADEEGRHPFGAHPDARVLALADELANPAGDPVLDIGAGDGRNALALARRGHPVDAIEPAPQFATELRRAAEAEALPVDVIEADFFGPGTGLREHHYRLAILAEVVPHFRSAAQLRVLFERVCGCLAADGLLLFSAFLATPGYEPDDLVRQMAEVAWSTLFTREELAEAMSGLPLRLLSDESVVEYEQAHLPDSAWPPTGWFADWASGRSLLPVAGGPPPVELRWILLRRSA